MRQYFVRFLSVLAVCLVGVSGQVSIAQMTQADRSVTVGDIDVRMMQDAHFYLPTKLLSGIEQHEASTLLGGSDSSWTPANAYLVRLPKQIVLVDAGVGKYPGGDSGHLLDALKKAGVEPDQIKLILITHFHLDHIGGLISPEGRRLFPNAVVRAAKAESDFWLNDSLLTTADMRERGAAVKKILGPYIEAKAFRPFAPNENLGDGIKVVPASGHTPGHTVYSFSSKGKELWCVGDLIHYGAIQFARPKVGVIFDTDGPKAIAARITLFQRAAASHIIIAAAHLPAMVMLEKKGDAFVAQPVEVH